MGSKERSAEGLVEIREDETRNESYDNGMSQSRVVGRIQHPKRKGTRHIPRIAGDASGIVPVRGLEGADVLAAPGTLARLPRRADDTLACHWAVRRF